MNRQWSSIHASKKERDQGGCCDERGYLSKKSDSKQAEGCGFLSIVSIQLIDSKRTEAHEWKVLCHLPQSVDSESYVGRLVIKKPKQCLHPHSPSTITRVPDSEEKWGCDCKYQHHDQSYQDNSAVLRQMNPSYLL
jgi:hypothetical protein